MKKRCKMFLLLVWIYSDILISANATVKYTYFSEGETVILMCMGDANIASWIGPAHNSSVPSSVKVVDLFGKEKIWKTILYTEGRHINPEIPYIGRLKVVDMEGRGKYDLQISNAMISDEGYYKCEIDLVEGKILTREYILQLRKLPSNLTIDDETEEDTVIGRENQLLKIACNVESGNPPGTMYWKHNGTILKFGGPQRIIYEFRTDRTYQNTKFTCEVKSNLTDEHLTKSIRLDIQYRPKVFIHHDKNMPVFEGTNKTLCCNIDSNPRISFISWSKDSINITSSINSSCLFFKRLNRQDRGNYTCLAGNEIGNGLSETSLTVFYPPSVYLEYKNFSINESMRAVQCKGDGEPNNITFFRLEHLSDFNEHIRYLDVSSDGIAKLPSTIESKRFQDTGFYICNASNGVLDEKGNMFQRAKAYLVSTGPPVFVDDNRKTQYGEIGKPMDIKINVFSTSAITNLDLNTIGIVYSPLPINKKLTKTVLLKIDFHGVNITVNGTELTFRLTKLYSFESYNVTVSNHFLASYFIVEVRTTGKTYKKEKSPTSIIAGCTAFVIIVLVGIMITKWIKRKQTNSRNIDGVSDDVEGISQPVENVMYQSQRQSIIEHPSPVSTLLPDVSSENTDTLSHNMEGMNASMVIDNTNLETENRLNYADVVFQPTSQNEMRIIGFEDRTVYADVNTNGAGALLPETRSETSSSEDDFVYVDGIENFIEKRETND